MDFGKIFDRIKAILSTPQTKWPVIAAEPATIGGLYRGYILIVAALPVIARFIKESVFGYGALGMHFRAPIGYGLVTLVLYYLLILGVAYVVALVVNALAPTFGGQKDPVQALKVVAYSWTAGWVAGIAVLIPWLGWLVAIAGAIYGIYLLYLGLPHTMRCPPDRAGGYTAVVVIIAFVFSLIVGGIITSIATHAGYAGHRLGSVELDDGHGGRVTVDPNSALGKLQAMGEQAEKASKDLDAAQKSGDATAQQAAMAKMMGPDGNVQSLPANVIEAFLPDTLEGMKRANLSAERTGAMGVQVTSGRAIYTDGNGHDIQLEVTDTGTMRGMMALAGTFSAESEQQTEHGYQKTYTSNDRMVHEAWDTASKNGEYGVVVGKRFAVKASGTADSIDQLRQMVAAVDLDKLESMKNEGVGSR